MCYYKALDLEAAKAEEKQRQEEVLPLLCFSFQALLFSLPYRARLVIFQLGDRTTELAGLQTNLRQLEDERRILAGASAVSPQTPSSPVFRAFSFRCVVPCSLILSLTHSALYLGRILQQNADKAALQQEIQQLTQRIDALRAEVEALRAVVRQLTEQLQVLREEIARLEGEVQWT